MENKSGVMTEGATKVAVGKEEDGEHVSVPIN